ncbi:MAG: zf-HC2 domain-containing protein [Bacteroidales bacterium]|nr:zf-HC2 domain-containing protein [Bacteroidales bacterium]
MNCLKEEQIQQYLDNECGPKEKEAIKRHLEVCTGCQEALIKQHQLSVEMKQSLDLLVTTQPAIPAFKFPERLGKKRRIVVKYLLPLAAAASLLLLVLLRPLSESGKTPINGQSIQFVQTEEFDANKPVTDYPMIMIIVAPDGTVTQTRIN